jgi:transglutaminase-like putative cysteine protease
LEFTVTIESRRFELGILVLLACVNTTLATGPTNRSDKTDEGHSEQSSPEGYALSVESVAKVVGTLTRDASYPHLKGIEWIVFASRAPERPGQIRTKTTLDPPGEPAREKSELGRPLVMARVRSDRQHPLNSMKIQLTYQATLRSRKLRRGQAHKVADLSAEERQRYLAERGFFDFNQPAFHEWVEKHGLERQANEGEIHFARRVFLALKGDMQYDAPLRKNFHATAVCKSGRADCGGLSVLFASILRLNNLPARTLWGRWAKSAEPGKIWFNHPYYQTHVKAEFFAQGVGWVPVDVSSAILHDQSPEGLKFFGNDAGDFITFHVDGNFEIDTLLFGIKSLGNLQTTRWWIRGDGPLTDEQVIESWQVKRSRLD